MIKTMKALLHVGAIGLMLSVGAMGGANLAFANNDHGGHSGGGGSSMSGGGWHGGSGGGMGGGMHGGGGDHHHPIGVVPGGLLSGLLIGPTGSGSGGTEFDDSGAPVTCGHIYTAHGAIGPRTCVATSY